MAGGYNAIASAGFGDFSVPFNGANNIVLIANAKLLTRIGQTPNYQEQFGTAALVPGPSAIPNTNDPIAIVGMPPFTNALNPIQLPAGNRNYIPKGVQINWVDLIYKLTVVPAVAIQFGICTINYQNNVAPVSTTLLAYGTNGLPTAVQALPYRKRINLANPVMITLDTAEIVLQLGLNISATSVNNFYGAVLGMTYNYN